MLQRLLLVVAFAVGGVLAWNSTREPVEPEPEVCCLICHIGKACGDTCIDRDAVCTLAEGCACDDEDLGVDA